MNIMVVVMIIIYNYRCYYITSINISYFFLIIIYITILFSFIYVILYFVSLLFLFLTHTSHTYDMLTIQISNYNNANVCKIVEQVDEAK